MNQNRAPHHYPLPSEMEAWINNHLKREGFDLSNPEKLAPAIMELSGHFQNQTSVTPWKEARFRAAYLAYFFPLNWIRCLKVIDQYFKELHFSEKSTWVDFGCGPGSFTKALLQKFPKVPLNVQGIDQDDFCGRLFLDTKRQNQQLHFQKQIPKIQRHHNLILSYALNELKETPDWLFQAGQIVIIEPSTKQAFSQLVALRDQLIANDFKILAPCPHQTQCPLSQSKKDWCHDRVYWQKPQWFEKLENHLPIKNPNMTFSFLVAQHRSIDEKKQNENLMTCARIVGDAQVEKGKTRFQICQSPAREFVSFLKRHGKAPRLYRGDLIYWKEGEKKGNEWRVQPQNIELKPECTQDSED